MTPFRRWIESKCKYSTQWGACNVSSSARSASDLGVLLNLSPVSFLRCVPVGVVSTNLLFLFPLPPFLASPEKKPAAEHSWLCGADTVQDPLPLFLCRAAPAAAAHAPAGGTARCRAGLVIVRDSVTVMQLPSFFIVCVCFIMFTCMFSFHDVSVSLFIFPVGP